MGLGSLWDSFKGLFSGKKEAPAITPSAMPQAGGVAGGSIVSKPKESLFKSVFGAFASILGLFTALAEPNKARLQALSQQDLQSNLKRSMQTNQDFLTEKLFEQAMKNRFNGTGGLNH